MKGCTEPLPILSIDEANRMVSVDSNRNRKWYAISRVELYEEPEIKYDVIMEDVRTTLGPWSVKYWNEKAGSDGSQDYTGYVTEIIEERRH